MLYKIYAIVDPINNKPFYIGATKVTLRWRLQSHVWSAKDTRADYCRTIKQISFQKSLLIRKILKRKHKNYPLIKLLCFADSDSVTEIEKRVYFYLKNLGYTFLQCEHQFNHWKYMR